MPRVGIGYISTLLHSETNQISFFFFHFYSVKVLQVSLDDMTFVKFPNNNLICLIFEIVINRSLQMMVIMVISCLLN